MRPSHRGRAPRPDFAGHGIWRIRFVEICAPWFPRRAGLKLYFASCFLIAFNSARRLSVDFG